MSSPGIINNIIRVIFVWLDTMGYWLVSSIYNVFFAVSSAEIISGSTVRIFYSRVQLIIGFVMLFRLAFTVLGIIVDPDAAKDSKKGVGSIIKRIAISLAMLTLVVPLNIPDTGNSPLYEKIKDNGILFGFLYQFQESVQKEQILGKLILGIPSSSTYTDEEGYEIGNMADVGSVMAATVAKSVLRPTILSEYQDEADTTTSAARINEIAACKDSDALADYIDGSVGYNAIISHITDDCDSDDGNVYAYEYTIIGGMAASVIMAIIIAGFTLDIAIRAAKLAVLRLIAPVPIILNISPDSGKDGAFENWTKTLISTYADLFVRIAIVYFGAYLIVLVASSLTGGDGINIIPSSGGFFTKALATIFIIIGILLFMKQSPKFIRDVLGIKGAPMSNIGLTALGTLQGALREDAGLRGAFKYMKNAVSEANEAAAQGKGYSPFAARQKVMDSVRQAKTGDRDARGGLSGRMDDYLNYAMRNRWAKKYGGSVENMNEFKNQEKQAQQEASEAAENLDFAKQNLKNLRITEDPGPNGSEQDKAAWRRYVDALEANTNAQEKLEKASKNVKYMDELRSALGVSPRVIDRYEATYRSENPSEARPMDPWTNSGGDTSSNSTTDDTTFTSSGHGSQTGPGGGPGPRGPHPPH